MRKNISDKKKYEKEHKRSVISEFRALTTLVVVLTIQIRQLITSYNHNLA